MKNLFCEFFGHKKDKHILAYNIESHHMFYIVTIYDIAKCSRCGEIYYNDMIDTYERYTWYTQPTVEKRRTETSRKAYCFCH